MGWWWKADVQTPVLTPSDPTPDPQPTASTSASPSTSREFIDQASPSTALQIKQSPDLDEPLLPPQSHDIQFDDGYLPDSSMYPSHMSCREVFDAAYYCQSLGGKFNDIYRYGSLQSCSPLWAQWRFCMRLKTLPESEKRRKVQQWYRENEARMKMKSNSEQVWRVREEPLKKFFHKEVEEQQDRA